MSREITSKPVKVLSVAIVAIIVLVPFQAFITTWLGATFGHIDLFRIWKELLLLPVTFGALWIAYNDKKIKSWLVNSPLVLVILLYVLANIGLGIYALAENKVNASALIYALFINLRFLVFFIVCMVIASKSTGLKTIWPKIILIPAIVVIVFGLLQQFVLPVNFLENFGYGQDTIPPYQTVDQKPEYVRIQSTTRGANPLGAYLLLISIATSALFYGYKKYRLNLAVIIFGVGTVLFFTYSRSAWLGTLLAGAIFIYYAAEKSIMRSKIIIAGLISLLIFGGLVLAYRDNNLLQNTLFHTDETSRSPESTNAVRTEAMLTSAKATISEPLGRGPGTAGPASFRNTNSPRISENYFIQITQEVGIIGLVLFVYINFYVSGALYKSRRDTLSLIVLASLAGLTLVNMLSHAWADDTIAYVFWGLAGIALSGPVILEQKANKNA